MEANSWQGQSQIIAEPIESLNHKKRLKMMKCVRQRWGYLALGAGLILFVIALGLYLNAPIAATFWLFGAALTFILSGVVIILSLKGNTKHLPGMVPPGQLEPQRYFADASPEEPVNACLHEMLLELSRMQSSNDLLERYEIFSALVELTLKRAVGDCEVSLWCPDREQEFLVECKLVSPVRKKNEFAAQDKRSPGRLPLTSSLIKQCLLRREAILNDTPGDDEFSWYTRPRSGLFCDGCIPLYRQYGQPLLLCLALNRTASQTHSSGVVRQNNFQTAARLIRLFWNHLQLTNQRQWQIEHEPGSGVLRTQVFLEQGQNLLQACRRRDELFSVVVLTIRGFRRMFAGQSHQWQLLTDVLGRNLKDILRQHREDALLGKMADDVFAVMITRMDKFLVRSIMDKLVTQLDECLRQEDDLDGCDVFAFDVAWDMDDSKSCAGSLEDMLNTIYRRMFERIDIVDRPAKRIILDVRGGQSIGHAGHSE